MQLHKKIYSGRSGDVEWPVCERRGLKTMGVLHLSSGESELSVVVSSDGRYGTAVDFE